MYRILGKIHKKLVIVVFRMENRVIHGQESGDEVLYIPFYYVHVLPSQNK